MRSRLTLAALALSMVVGACGKDSTTAPNSVADNQTPAAPTAPTRAKQALIFDQAGQQYTSSVALGSVTYTLQSVQVTHFAPNANPATRGQFPLLVSGEFTFTDAAGVIYKERFTDAPADLTSSGSPTQPVCQILRLDIGAIHLNLLGLVVDLAPVHLLITAVSGPGNLLGNLLCALVHLLDGNPLAAALTNLLNTINALLQQLLP